MALIVPKLRESARGQQCTLQTSYCSGNTETVVLCHCPSEWKGMGNKSPDWCSAFGCFECHTAMDQHRFDVHTEAFYWFRGILRTWAVWIENGLIELPVDVATAKKRPKKKASMPSRKIPSRPMRIIRLDQSSRNIEEHDLGSD